MADRRITSAILLEELAEDDLFTQFNSYQTLEMDVMNVSLSMYVQISCNCCLFAVKITSFHPNYNAGSRLLTVREVSSYF
jgi:hypothetical protein